MPSEIEKRLRDFYNRLVDRPLTPDDPYYEPFLKHAAGDVDPIARLTMGISWSDTASVSLLSGQRGSGKSTELRRLKADLESEGCVVFLCDMRDYMNLTQPIEIGDFFISVMAALSDEVENEYGEDPSNLVLNYRNGDDWYGVHPLLIEKIEAVRENETVSDD